MNPHDFMNPQDYAAGSEYRPPAVWYRRLNWLGVLLTSLGLAPRDAVTPQVRGRSSGKLRRLSILRTHYRDEGYLVALAGVSQWVRNVRAADGHVVIRRRKTRKVRFEELAPAVTRTHTPTFARSANGLSPRGHIVGSPPPNARGGRCVAWRSGPAAGRTHRWSGVPAS